MKIERMLIKNFRSLDDVSVTFVNDLMCVVGKNDVGKSSLIKAIETFFSVRTFEKTDFPYNSTENTETQIELRFTDVLDIEDEFKIDNKVTLRMLFNKGSNFKKKYTVFKKMGASRSLCK